MSKFRTYTFMTDKKSSNNEENDEIYEPVKIDDDLPLTVVDITVKELKSKVLYLGIGIEVLKYCCLNLEGQSFMKTEKKEQSIQMTLH